VDESDVASMVLNIQAEFDLFGGQVTATNGLLVGFGDFADGANLNQYGGSVNADTTINGNYTLNNGTITGRMSVISPNSFQRANAAVVQTGGTNFAVSLSMGNPNRFGGVGTYTLSNGLLSVESSMQIHGSPFAQYNGQAIVSDLEMTGANLGGFGIAPAEYLLAGGTLSAGGLLEQSAHFTQNGGTNQIAASFVLTATSPIQTTWYTLSGGSLVVKDISLNNGAFFQHTSGNIIHSGLLTLSQGEWRAAAAAQSLGPLQLTIGSSNNSAITFPPGASALRLANSSGEPWNSSAILYINNWHGSISGGGATQLNFGSNSVGLTSQQLSQIRFALSGSLYPAKILATGEVVPIAPPIIEFARNGNTLTLTWPSGSFLQSATNVVGPYSDLPGAISPYTINTTIEPQRFFRLRQ
jgi:hypothetical protein